MTTILNEIQASGTGLMDGRESCVRIMPSDKKGIYFYPENSNLPVKACLGNVISTQNCVILENNENHIRVVEHFMAACAFSGIDSLEVHLSSSELPILDGSALNWVNFFNNAGIQKSNNSKSINIDEPLYFSSENTSLVMLPAESFEVTYCVDFNHSDLAKKWHRWNISDNAEEILEARTFGYLCDLEKFQKAGLALGATVENTVGITESGYTTELRSENEPVKHKILDLIGDLSLMEINPLDLNAKIIAQEAGHKSHVEFAKVIYSYLEKKLCRQVKN